MPKDQSVSKALAGMQSNWGNSQKFFDTEFSGVKIPEGTYLAKLAKCYLKLNTESGAVRLNRQFVILEGEHESATVRDGLSIGGSEMGDAILRRFIEQAGYQPPGDLTELPDTVEAIEKDASEFKIQVKHKGDFVNVYILQDDEEVEGEEAEEGEEAAAEDTEVDEAEVDEAAEQQRLDLIAFAAANGIEAITEESTLEEITAELGDGYEFEAKEMVEDEIKLLTAIGLGSAIKGLPPKKTAPVKAAAKKAAPAPAKSAAKPAGKTGAKPLPRKR